jgi:outer membrane protein assembly factor BamB
MLAAAVLALLADESWTEFRGPNGTGHSDSKGLPKEWSETQNVAWKTAIRGKGWSSPVVLGGQVWLTSATPDGKEMYAICVDRESGKILLDEKLWDVAAPKDTAKFNSFASPSPVIEEGRVYLHFGSYGTVCLDTKTFKRIWERKDIECDHWRGPGSSPILYKDLLILTYDGYDVQFVTALDKATGKTVWKTDRTHDFKTQDGDQKKGYSTPAIFEIAGKAQLISIAARGVHSLDPSTGKPIWYVEWSNAHSPATRPILVDGLITVATGFQGTSMMAIKPDGQGNVSASHVVWKATKGVGTKPSPLLVGDLLYTIADPGVAACFESKTGVEVWSERLKLGVQTASPLYADGGIYWFTEKGTTVITAPGREFKEIGRGTLDGGGVMGTPAIAGKALYARTGTHLYRLEKK